LGRKLIEDIEVAIGDMYSLEGIDDENSFFQKKTITSAIRRYAPLGISTEEVWTANIRDIRHVLEVRSSIHAEEEVRIVANQIGSIMIKKAPFLFQDYDLDSLSNPIGEWITPNQKV
jgi:thymidylate synthase (FAD)